MKSFPKPFLARVALLMVFPVVTAGCADVPDEATPGALQESARLVVRHVSVSPTTIEAGETVTATVTVANEGTLPGAGDVKLTLDGRHVGTVSVSVEPGMEQERTLRFQPVGRGLTTLLAALGSTRESTYLDIRAPLLRDGTWDYEDLWCEDSVPFHVTFRNAGDGTAQQVTVEVTLYNENDVAQDTEQHSVGSISPGGTGRASFDLFARDACGRDDYYFALVEVHAHATETLRFRTDRFSI